MAAVPIFHGSVREGKILFDNPDAVKRYVPTLDGKRVEMVLRREVQHKSRNQRSYFHVCVGVLAHHVGQSAAYVKAFLKLKILWDGESVDRFGIPVVPSTEDLSKEQYAFLIERTQQFAAEWDCPLERIGYME